MLYSDTCFSVSKWYHWPNQTSDVIWLSQQGFQKHLTGGCKWKAFIHMHKALPLRELKTPVKKGIIFFYIYKILYPRLTNTEYGFCCVKKWMHLKSYDIFKIIYNLPMVMWSIKSISIIWALDACYIYNVFIYALIYALYYVLVQKKEKLYYISYTSFISHKHWFLADLTFWH